jgi:RNA recognition motif-containing protein
MSNRLYVGNLNKDISEQELQEFFSSYGTVISVLIKKDSVTGEPWGYGFVEMENQDQADLALKQANGEILYEQKLRIDPMGLA